MKKYFLVLIVLELAGASSFAQESPNLDIVWQKNIFPTQISFAKFSADGNFLYCAVGNNIKKMSVETGEFVSDFENENVSGIYEMRISKLGNLIVTRDGGGALNLWDVNEEKAIKYMTFFAEPGKGGISCVDISPDEKYLLVGGWVGSGKNTTSYVAVYDMVAEEEVHRFAVPNNGHLRNIRISNNGQLFATGSYVYNEFENKYYNQLILWQTETWEQKSELDKTEGDFDVYKEIQFSENDNYIAALKTTSFQSIVYDISTKEILFLSDPERNCANISLLPDNLHLLVMYTDFVGNNPEFELYDIYENYIHNFPISASIIETYRDNDLWKIFCYGLDKTALLINNPTNVKEPVIPNHKFQLEILNNSIIINLKDINYSELDVFVSNLMGKVVYSEKINIANTKIKIPLNAKLPSGIYFCKIIYGNEEFVQKFEIAR